MPSYPTVGDIEARWRVSGSRCCIIVEGENEAQDSWYYGYWFGRRSQDVLFFPQDGWEKVAAAVQDLREKLGAGRVFGIIDRDFAAWSEAGEIPADGILRTPKYSLENYLLDPRCWHAAVSHFMLRRPRPEWQTPENVATTIAALYRECIPLSAYNWVLRQLNLADDAALSLLTPQEREYRRHPQALRQMQPSVEENLRSFQERTGTQLDLVALYRQRVVSLEAMHLAELEQVVSGEYVLKLLQEKFPIRFTGRDSWDDFLSAYVSHCPEPPADLVLIVDLIVDEAKREHRPQGPLTESR